MTDTPTPFDAIYNVDRWGDGYFRIGGDGHLRVRPQGEAGGEATLEAVLAACLIIAVSGLVGPARLEPES